MQTIKLTGKVGDEIALEYDDKTLVVKLTPDAIVPDFVDVLLRAMKLDSHAVATLCLDYYHRYTTPDEAFLPRLAAIRDNLFLSLNPSEEEPEEEPEPVTESESEATTEPVSEEEPATKSTKRTTKKNAKNTDET